MKSGIFMAPSLQVSEKALAVHSHLKSGSDLGLDARSQAADCPGLYSFELGGNISDSMALGGGTAHFCELLIAVLT